jgi:hypothetical protein
MNHAQAQGSFEGIKIAITVEQRVPILQTEGRDPAINRLAHDVSLTSEIAVIPGRCPGHLDSACIENFKSSRSTFFASLSLLIPRSTSQRFTSVNPSRCFPDSSSSQDVSALSIPRKKSIQTVVSTIIMGARKQL